MRPNEVTEVLNRPLSQELLGRDLTRLTIDTEVHPPKILLIRGVAELDVVEGHPG